MGDCWCFAVVSRVFGVVVSVFLCSYLDVLGRFGVFSLAFYVVAYWFKDFFFSQTFRICQVKTEIMVTLRSNI